MPLPTFVIAGAQRCGTSTLTAYLRRHPRIFMTKPKELHFFDGHFELGLAWYSDQFTPKQKHRHWGEATPMYAFDPVARERLHDAVPEAKLIVIFRDPAKRAYSHYWHAVRDGHETLDSFGEALDQEEERLASGDRDDLIHHSYVARGHYIDQVEALIDLFGHDQLHVMLFDDLVADRQESLRDVFGFLDVGLAPAATIDEMWASHRADSLGVVADEPVIKQRQTAPYPPVDRKLRARLVEHFQPYNDRLGAWMGRDLSSWNKI
jgi:hypothetical protein